MKLGVPAMDPYPIKFIYNVSQIMLCAYMTLEALLLAYRNGYSALPCVGYDRQNPPLANLLWLFYVSKVRGVGGQQPTESRRWWLLRFGVVVRQELTRTSRVCVVGTFPQVWDFWDTIFIVIGKKWRQLSFLHVYHHITIFLFYWLNAHVNYDGDIYLTIVLNGFIHTVMYTYYFICMHTRDPITGKSLPIWWKSSLTMMQMIQFVTMMSQGTYLLATQCPTTSLRVVFTYIVYILSLFFLFAQFFMQSYVKPNKKKTA